MMAGPAIPSLATWDESEPLSVKVAFGFGFGEPIVWDICRDILGDAIARPEKIFGDGDVCARVSFGMMFLNLQSPDGQIMLTASTDQLGAFLLKTYERVPRGQETVDIDACIERLLS